LARRESKVPAEDQNRVLADNAARELPDAVRTTAPAVPAQAELQTAKAAARRGRSGQTPQGVDIFATIFLVKIGSTLTGRILDLTLGGCRIHTDECFPVGIYTRVETEFRLEGLTVRLGGVIQEIHDRNTVGVRFLDLSDRKRRQVQELIGEIEQMRQAQKPFEHAAAEDRAMARGR
jgi:hypothetical protein